MTGKDFGLGWTRAFQVTWIIGFCGSSLVYYLICLISPPPGAPYVMEYLDSHVDPTIEGHSISEEETAHKYAISSDAKDLEGGK